MKAEQPTPAWEAGATAAERQTDGDGRASAPVRQRLVAAIVEEVAARGYASTTLAGVCRRAGTRPAEFHRHFAGKDACFLAACRDFADALLERVHAALASSRDWNSGVRAGLGAFLDYMAEHPRAAHACMIEGLAAGPEALAIRDTAMRSFAGFFEEFRGRSAPVGGADALVSEAGVGGIYEIVIRRVRDGETATLPELLPGLTYYLLAPVVGRPQAQIELTGSAR